MTIFCENTVREKVKTFFENTFANEWKAACEKADKALGGIVAPKDKQLIVTTCADGVSVNVIGLEILYAAGDFYNLQYGRAALENALKLTKGKFPAIEYDGYLIFALSDRHAVRFISGPFLQRIAKENSTILLEKPSVVFCQKKSIYGKELKPAMQKA